MQVAVHRTDLHCVCRIKSSKVYCTLYCTILLLAELVASTILVLLPHGVQMLVLNKCSIDQLHTSEKAIEGAFHPELLENSIYSATCRALSSLSKLNAPSYLFPLIIHKGNPSTLTSLHCCSIVTPWAAMTLNCKIVLFPILIFCPCWQDSEQHNTLHDMMLRPLLAAGPQALLAVFHAIQPHAPWTVQDSWL